MNYDKIYDNTLIDLCFQAKAHLTSWDEYTEAAKDYTPEHKAFIVKAAEDKLRKYTAEIEKKSKEEATQQMHDFWMNEDGEYSDDPLDY
jgi:hypothetical protein